MIKAAFFDVDGTLVSHKISDTPASAVRALNSLRRSGVKIILSTGRHRSELAELPLHRFPFDGYITLTGQICYDSRFLPIYLNPVSGPDKTVIIDAFNRKSLPIILVNQSSLYINFINATVIQIQKEISTPVPPIGEYRGEELFMAIVYGTEQQIQAFSATLAKFRLSRWHEHAADIIPVSGGKAEGMKVFQNKFNIRRDEIIAFGDGENDIDMIRYAGIGIAMGNASDQLKAVADYITLPVEQNGVESALRQFGLLP